MKGVSEFRGKHYWLLLLFAIFFSCQEADRRPDDILSEQEMVKVLAEVYIAEQKVSRLGLGNDSASQVFDKLQHRVFETTGVPDTVFKKSMNYYMERPKEMEKIYGILVDSLQLREQRTPSRQQ